MYLFLPLSKTLKNSYPKLSCFKVLPLLIETTSKYVVALLRTKQWKQKPYKNGKSSKAKQNKCICTMPWSLFARLKHWQTAKRKKFQTENHIAKLREFKFKSQQQEPKHNQRRVMSWGWRRGVDFSYLPVSQIISAFVLLTTILISVRSLEKNLFFQNLLY